MGAAEIVKHVTDAMTATASGAVDVISTIWDGVFLNAEGTGLSGVAIWGLTFLGVGFVLGLIRKFTAKAG